MQNLTDRIGQVDALLASYAVKNAVSLGRRFPESDDVTRFPFQRDRDRIIHTQSFRRLKHKTQVFVSGHGDHYRTRITHTLEVAQISRDIARTLGLNEDLAEAIALAHDLGHTPFGHAGETAMDECLKPFGKRFEHNEQSLRIATLLEDHCSLYPGLNLSVEILEGLRKHSTSRDCPDGGIARSPSLEAQIVNMADEIAYTAHDTDDGLRAGLFTASDIMKTNLGSMASKRDQLRQTELRGAMVDLLVTDLYAATEAAITMHSIVSLDDVYIATVPIVGFSEKMQEDLGEHRGFLWDRLYRSAAVLKQAAEGKRIINELFTRYVKAPSDKVKELRYKTGGALEEAVKDYIAGMTDTFAIAVYEREGK